MANDLETAVNSRSNELTYAELRGFFPADTQEYLVDYLVNLQESLITVAQFVDQIVDSQTYEPQFGTGSPEGVVTANLNRTYYDLTGVPELWVNPTAGSNTGWVQVV